eukprot:scaffold36350_cov117-Skeletonema_dohrnii-CCMP3373.AAC.1
MPEILRGMNVEHGGDSALFCQILNSIHCSCAEIATLCLFGAFLGARTYNRGHLPEARPPPRELILPVLSCNEGAAKEQHYHTKTDSHYQTMGKTSRKKKQTLKSREAGKAAASQIVRIGEKERCTNCKNWVQFGSFELQLGKPPHRAECGDNAKCDGCDFNLCYDCCITEKNSNRLTKWLLCANNRTGFGGSNDCIRGTPIKICSDCANVKRKRSDAGISDMEHQKDYPYIHCGGEMCIPDEGSGGRPRQECRECALSGERMMRICHLCDKIRCIACIGYAKDLGGDLSGETNTGWGIIRDMMDMGDMLKTTFINDFIKRCGDCGRDVCME